MQNGHVSMTLSLKGQKMNAYSSSSGLPCIVHQPALQLLPRRESSDLWKAYSAGCQEAESGDSSFSVSVFIFSK